MSSGTTGMVDLLIVGSGIAGLSATVTAREAGLSTTTLERSVEEEFGGGSRWTEAYLRYRTTATGLLRAADGRVAGVRATGPDGRGLELRARATLMACGGYQGNAEMMARYLGPIAANIRPVARGGYYNRGEGIQMM